MRYCYLAHTSESDEDQGAYSHSDLVLGEFVLIVA
jgi:hypothetical protein